MNMQDNEMDELFRSGLANFEVEPSSQIWKNISAKLDEGKPKRKVMPWLSIAVSVLVLSAIGVWVMFKQNHTAQVEHHYAAQTKPKAAVTIPALSTRQAAARVSNPSGNLVALHTNTIIRYSAKHLKATARNNQAHVSTNQLLVRQTVQPAQVLVANNTAMNGDITEPVLPEVQLTRKTIADESPVFKSINAVAVAPVALQQQEKKVHKHSIRSLGDVINVLVAKVDKREDKIIEFTDTDDDYADITGINLGIIKVKKEK